jgi:hypothetical protein
LIILKEQSAQENFGPDLGEVRMGSMDLEYIYAMERLEMHGYFRQRVCIVYLAVNISCLLMFSSSAINGYFYSSLIFL